MDHDLSKGATARLRSAPAYTNGRRHSLSLREIAGRRVSGRDSRIALYHSVIYKVRSSVVLGLTACHAHEPFACSDQGFSDPLGCGDVRTAPSVLFVAAYVEALLERSPHFFLSLLNLSCSKLSACLLAQLEKDGF